jgi:hypothetical protein
MERAVATFSAPIGDRLDWARRVCEAAAAHPDGLTDYEVSFAVNLQGNLQRNGGEAHLSPKEVGIARRIGRKLGVAL